MFFRHKKTKQWDASQWKPVIRVSICTGEETAGFENRKSHVFKEVCLIRNASDLQAFQQEYGIRDPIEKIF
jgi:hypothetical protein